MYRYLFVIALVGGVAVAQEPKQKAEPQEKKAQKAKARPTAEVIPPTAADYSYGPHPRNKFDFWQAKSDAPTPLVLIIHGGGWVNGDKSGTSAAAVKSYLDAGISVAALNYRFIKHGMEEKVEPPVKAPLHDAARALQTLRSKAKEWNIDKTRVGSTGGSAGACTSLWLAFHDDLADPKSSDPIARESTRLTCAAVNGAQTSLDPKQIREWMPNATYAGHAFGFAADGRARREEFRLALENRDKILPWIREYSPIELVTKDDPPVFLDYPAQDKPPVAGEEQRDPTHSAVYGIELEKKMKEVGVECVVAWPGHKSANYGGIRDFLVTKLKGMAPAAGAAVPNLTLPDIHRRPRSLAGFKDAKAFVVVFVGTECPIANLYVPTLIELHKDYAAKGVQFLAINSNSQDTFTLVSAHAQERAVPFPVLKDFDHAAADAFGARRTPEAFVLDAGRVIRYRGRIDDQYGVGVMKAKPTRQNLKEALDEVLAGKSVTTPATDVAGCVTGRAPAARVEGVTYTKHVAPILQAHCQECHRPGEIGPFALMSYESARGWAETIKEVIQEERMPPWYADPRHGSFDNDRRLARTESDTLLSWVAAGCPKGDDKDLPPPRQFTIGWKIGTPETVYQMPEAFQVPAAATQKVLDYQRFTVDPGFKEDVWVQAAECRPGNRAVVHHILVYTQSPGQPLYDRDGTAHTLAGWAPGDMPLIYSPGTAKLIPAGSKLVFEVHYTPTGTPQTDRSSVGIIFAKKPPERPVETNVLANMFVRIPPGAANQEGRMTYTFRDNSLILGFMPHMHLRGVSAKYVATYPDGRTETLLSVPDYDFNWQSVYRFKEPVRVPKGTKLTWIGHWDNSADNPRNPDPKTEVRWGYQTFDEMQNGWMDFVREN